MEKNLDWPPQGIHVFPANAHGPAKRHAREDLRDRRLCHELFVSFPQKRNGIVFSSGVNYLHSGDNIQSELSS